MLYTVLLELLTGSPPVDYTQRPPNLYARMRLPGQAEAAADPAAGWAGAARRGLGALGERCVMSAGMRSPARVPCAAGAAGRRVSGVPRGGGAVR